ncbi:MAG: dTDP-4-dehydrorhamnose 3,5-epimerase family protein [Alphaproteobacteria bacterium]|nr:dTDP-4-dehydrorhamnose 3,5-epimerase family protein [Alphaproteobacteria bacterium]
MKIEALAIQGAYKIRAEYHEDQRGYFAEIFKADFFSTTISPLPLIQENIALSREVGTIRGLHAQQAPAAQGKLLRVIRGKILDMVVDVRPSSPSYGRVLASLMPAAERLQLWLPPGLLHGYQVLEADTEISYQVSAAYAPQLEYGVIWNDPELNLPWLDRGVVPLLSPKDQNLPSFGETRAAIAAGKLIPI